MKTVTIHNQRYEYYSWASLGEDIFILAKKILESKLQFDRIIALAKGGLTFSRSLVDYLQVGELSSIQIEFYTGIGTTHKTPVITQSLPVSIKGERILIFDDIVDKGDTMKLARDYINVHGPKSITTAALITKPWTSYQVDFTAQSTEAWIIFPNEARETINELSQLWAKKGNSPEEIALQLQNIGFSEAEVALFSNLG